MMGAMAEEISSPSRPPPSSSSPISSAATTTTLPSSSSSIILSSPSSSSSRTRTATTTLPSSSSMTLSFSPSSSSSPSSPPLLPCFLSLLILLSHIIHPLASSLPSTLPSSCLHNTALHISCPRSNLFHIPPLPHSTETLDLDHNHISLLQNGSLHGVPNLRELSLQDNGLLHLESGVFDALGGLRRLLLGRNHLSSLPEDVFAGVRQLELLDLHANYFASVPGDVAYHLNSLMVLNLSFNHLTALELGAGFRYTTELSVIDLSGNDLTSIESDSFEAMQFWDDLVPRHINLSYTGLRHIAPLSLQHIPRLTTLSFEGNIHVPQSSLQLALKNADLSSLESINLSHMNISDLVAFVHDFQPGALTHLYLSYDRIRTIPKGTFFFFVNLRLLDLAHNEISLVENLAGLSKLETLCLAYNNIESLTEMMFEGLHELKVLDVSHNGLTRIDDAPLLNLFNLHTLDITGNQVQQVHINDGLESLETLQAAWNRISSLRFLQRLRRLSRVDLSHNIVTRLGEEVFARGQKVSIANLSSNAIVDISPSAFRYGGYDVLDLSHNGLTALGHHGWEAVGILYLQHNSIQNLTGNAFRGLYGLREVHLEGNKLFAFPRDVFTDLRNLSLIDLSSNPIGDFIELPHGAQALGGLHCLEVMRLRGAGLSRLPALLLQDLTRLRLLDLGRNRLEKLSRSLTPLLSRLTSLDLSQNGLRELDAEVLTRPSSRIQTIDLSSNPFDCTCELVPLCQRLFSSSHSPSSQLTVLNSDNRTLYQCATPVEWTSVSLSEFYESSGRCSTFEITVVCVIVASIVTVVVVIAAVTWCRCRTLRRQRKRRLPKARPSTEYKFVDETSLTSSSNSSSNNGAVASGGGHQQHPSTTVCLLSKQWV